MANQQISNPPTAAYYLTLIGGILGAIVGIFTLFIIVGVWIIIANVLMIIFAQRLMNQPNEYSKYGTYIIVLSILGGLNILCLIGGILALTYRPTLTAQQPYYQPYTQPTSAQPVQYASSKYCPQCGNAVGAEAQYCPKCGTKMPT